LLRLKLVPVLVVTLAIYPATYCYMLMASTANFVKYLWWYNYGPVHEV